MGDFVNRGPDSLGTLRLLRDLKAQGVLGNHDLHLLRVRAGRRKIKRHDTLGQVLEAPDGDELCTWLADRPFLRRWDDLYLVHAGLHPNWTDPMAALSGIDPGDPDAHGAFAVRVRHCDPKGGQPDSETPPAPAPYKPWFEYYDPDIHGGRTVVFGHWAMMGLVHRPHLRGLDTGCVWGGRLTAWIAEEDRLVDVPAERAYARIT